MIDYLRRLVIAIESISHNINDMRSEQKEYMQLAKNNNSPENLLRAFEQAKQLLGGNNNGK